MSSKVDSALRGFCIPWYSYEDITKKPSQAGEAPGIYTPASTYDRGSIEASNAQGSDLSILALDGGNAGQAQLAMRLSSESTDRDWILWSPSNLLTDYYWISDDAVDAVAMVVAPSTQQLVLFTAGINLESQNQVKVYTFNHTTNTVSSESVIQTGGTPLNVAICADALSDGRIYLITVGMSNSGGQDTVKISADEGATWTQVASSPFGKRAVGVLSPDDCCTASAVGNMLVFLSESSSGNAEQHISTSNGGSFQKVASFSGIGTSLDCCALDNGSFIVVYLNALGHPTVSRLGNASEPLDSVAATTLVSAPAGDISVCSDSFGVQVFVRFSSAIRVWLSEDGGATFTEFGRGPYESASVSRYIRDFDCGAYQGRVAVPFIVENAAANSYDGGAGLILLGGWHNITIGPYLANAPKGPIGSASLGYGAVTASQTGLPLDVPHNVGWTHITTGGTSAISQGTLEVSTTVQTHWWSISNAGTNTLSYCAVKVLSGGDKTANDIIWGSKTTTTDWKIRLDTTGFTVYDDTVNSIKATVLLDMTAEYVHIMAKTGTGGLLTVVYRLANDRKWTTAVHKTALNTGGVYAPVQEFGHSLATTAASSWKVFAWTGDASTEILMSQFDLAAVEGLAGNYLKSATPLHHDFYSSETGKASFLKVAEGSFLKNETGTLERSYDYGIDRAVPQLSPSPSVTWRSKDKTETTIEFSAPNNPALTSRLGNSWAPSLFIANANFNICLLEYWDGASWISFNFWRSFEGAVTYDRNGSTITPKTGTPAISRYYRHNELSGGYALFAGLAGRRITGHGAGVWSDVVGSDSPKAVLHLEGMTGAEPATGSVLISQGSALLISYASAPIYATKWRVKIVAGLVGPDDYYEAGILTPMYFVPMGRQWSNGYSVDGIPNFDSERDRNATEYRQSRGGPTRIWTLPYADGYSARNLVDSPTDPDYLAPSAGLSLSAYGDVYSLLQGILKETRGSTPIVAVRSAPASGGMVLGADDYLYGYLDGPAGYDNVAGDDTEGTEFNRGTSIRVVEIV